MLIFHEIKKAMCSSVVRITAITLLFACVLISYFTVKNDKTETLTANQIQTEYDKQTALYIDNAKRGLKHLEDLGREDDYAHRYYEKVIELYTKATDGKKIENDGAVGWERLLTSNEILLLSLAMAIVVGGISVFEEKRTGAISVIFASKYGRAKTAAAKAVSVMTVSALFCLLFTAVSVAVYFTGGHLSGGLAELQTARSFRFSPYNITLLSCFLRITGVRMMISALFGVLTAMFSELFTSYVLILTASVIPAAAEYLIFRITYVGVDKFAKNVNIFSFGGSYLYERYYSVRLFGCADAMGVNIMLTSGWMRAAFFLFIVLFSVRKKQTRTAEVKKTFIKLKKPVIKTIPKTLFGWELKKNLLYPYVIIIAAVCLTVSCVVSVNTYGGQGNTDEKIYRQYCETFEKMTLGDAIKAISEEQERIERADGLRAEAEIRFDNGEITGEEFSAVMDEYGYCKAHEASIKRCAERAAYLRRLDSFRYEIRFVYDGTLNELLGGEFSFILVILLTVCLSAVFSREHESGAYGIIHTYKYGRKQIFISKILFTVAVTALLFLLVTAVDLIVCISNGAFANASASVYSLTPAKDVSIDVSIGQYLLIMYLLRFAAYELFAVIAVSLSAITGKTAISSAFSAVLVFVPYIVGKFGNVPLFADLSALMSANAVLLSPDKCAADFIVMPVFAALLLFAAYIRSTAGGFNNIFKTAKIALKQ